MKCFVIGNGKSLTTDQLDLIAGQPSIACNRINLVYPDTAWRPTIYVHPESLAPDLEYVKENIELGIECYIGEHFAKPPKGVMNIDDAQNVHWIKECWHHLLHFDNPEVLDEWHLPQLCSFGGSVNIAMQIAVQKGYDEIVLLGCDLEYRQGKKNHFHPDYEHGGEQPAFYQSRNALYGHIQALNTIHRKNLPVKVYNATIGGHLDIWERKDLQCFLSAAPT